MSEEKYRIENGLNDSILEKTIKNRLDYGDKVNIIRLDLARKGHKLAKIDYIIKRYSKEDIKNEEPDAELVKKIDSGLFNDESIQDVIKKLYYKGYSKDKFKRALPLVNIKTKIELVKMIMGWDKYFILLQAWVVIATILVGFFYNNIFFIASFIMAGQMFIEYLQIKKEKQIRGEITKLPFEKGFNIDLLLKEENLRGRKVSRLKAFFNRIIESHYFISIFFLLFGISFGIMYGLIFFTICTVFSLVSFVSFWRPFKI